MKDKFGVSWQIVPAELPALIVGPNAGKVMQALLQMGKLDLATLRRAAGGWRLILAFCNLKEATC